MERGGGSSSPEEAPLAAGMMLKLGMMAQLKSPIDKNIIYQQTLKCSMFRGTFISL